MIVGSTVHPIYIAHGFTYRLAKTDADGKSARAKPAFRLLSGDRLAVLFQNQEGWQDAAGRCSKKAADVMVGKIDVRFRKKQMVAPYFNWLSVAIRYA